MRKKTAIWVSVFLGLLVCAVLVYIPVSEAHKEQQYEEALSLYEDQFYDAAYDQFYPLREWKAEANAYAHICRARVLLSQGKPMEARREMYDVSLGKLPDDLVLTVQGVNRAIDIAVSSAQPTRTSAPAPTPTPKPVWTPAPSSGRKWYDEDEYNTSDYDDPENFYEDHYDDFIDYYDAEDYWYDHYDD